MLAPLPSFELIAPALTDSAIREQLGRLFAHPAFKNSHRSQDLLRYIVEHRLQNSSADLKERTLGIEVFHRPAAYDTNADSVVRVAAGEVRKRIAQYYHEPGHESEARIDLPVGAYLPEFHHPAAASAALEISPRPTAAAPEAGPLAPSGRRGYGKLAGVAAGLLVLILAGGFTGMRWLGHLSSPVKPVMGAAPALTAFWRPVMQSSGPVQIDVGRYRIPGINRATTTAEVAQVSTVAWTALMATSRVTEYLGLNGKRYLVQDPTVTKLSTLTEGPNVFIGAFNNNWTIRLTDGLRFHFIRMGRARWIVDRQAPAKTFRTESGTLPNSTRQFAIVARLASAATGQYSVILAGIDAPATMLAGDFVTNPRAMEALAKKLGPGWESKDLEAVISGQAVGGVPGAAHVLAAVAW